MEQEEHRLKKELVLFLNKLNSVKLKLIFLKNTNFLKQKKPMKILREEKF